MEAARIAPRGGLLGEYAPQTTSWAFGTRILHGTDERQRCQRYRCAGTAATAI